MYLINNIHFVFTYLRRDAYLFHQLSNIIYRIIRSRIQFMNIVRALFIESHARLTRIASFSIRCGCHTVDCLGKDTCASRLSHPPRSAKQIGVSQFLCGNGILQRSGQCPLSHHRFKSGWTIFTGRYNIIFHTSDFLFFAFTAKVRKKA